MLKPYLTFLRQDFAMLLNLVLNLCTQAILQSYTPELLGLHIHSARPSLQHNSYLGIWCQTVYGIHSLKQSCTLNPLKSDRWWMPHLALHFGGTLHMKLSCMSLKRELFFAFPPCHPNTLVFAVTPTQVWQSARFHSCHTLMAPCCKQQNINAGAWSIWP